MIEGQSNACGSCTLCCTVMKVEMEPVKPAFTPCGHICKGGCAIYESRPEACRVWSCLWRHSQDREPSQRWAGWMRPDRTDIVLNTNSAGYVLAHCATESAWQRPAMNRWLRDMALRTRVMITLPSDRQLLLKPSGSVEELRFAGVDPGTNERLYKRAGS